MADGGKQISQAPLPDLEKRLKNQGIRLQIIVAYPQTVGYSWADFD